MNCENCKIEMELFDRICYNCGFVVEYAPRTVETRVLYSPLTETQNKEIGTDKNKARSRLWLLWFVPLLITTIAAGVLFWSAVIVTVAFCLYYILLLIL